MGVRLNKVLSELNIGLQTAVDFLKNKKELGEVKDEMTPNTKISDEQYQALVSEFNGDKAVKTQADMMFTKKVKEKKAEKSEKSEKPEKALTKTEEMMEQRTQLKTLGKINLDEIGKTKAAPAPKETPKEAPVVEAKPKEKAEVKSEPKVEAKPESQGEVKPEPVVEEKSEVEEPVVEKEEPQEKEEQVETLELAKTPGDAKIAQNAPQLNVLGKIDLSTLNQSTRPKKKTKEERRKEREEKAAGERRKRERIRTDKVDIEAAAKQANQQGGGKKNKNNNNNNGQQQNQQGGGKKNKKNRPVKPLEVDDEAVARQVKETLARLTSKTNQNKKGAKYRKEKRDAVAERMSEEMAAEAADSKVLKLTEFVTVSELATMMNVGVNQVIGTCMSIGIMVSINQRLDAETINIVAEEFGFTTEYVSAEVQNAITEEEDDENDLISRAPIVTVMGHVDHGKTSLLDHIRNTNVIAGEAGGITQHIGAYNVKLKDGHSITFLDTPGHEAFTAMRARGAQVTDIAIIIIAADDSVMPTTKEAIAHAQAANVPMVFAINKIDKPGANPDKIREDLANMNLLVEEWGGKYQCQEISAKKGIGVYELLEKVLLVLSSRARWTRVVAMYLQYWYLTVP